MRAIKNYSSSFYVCKRISDTTKQKQMFRSYVQNSKNIYKLLLNFNLYLIRVKLNIVSLSKKKILQRCSISRKLF